MDKTQLEYKNKQIKARQAKTMETIKKTIQAISDKCDVCGKRPKAINTAGTLSRCQRCIEIGSRVARLNSKSLIRNLLELVGADFIDAEAENVPVEFQIYSAPGDIYLYGGLGVGKTYAMAALLKDKMFAGHSCANVNFDAFCSRVRSTWTKGSKVTEADLIGEMSNVDCLFMDDLGLRTKQESDFAYVTLFTILNNRQADRLPTYFTSNKDIKTLAKTFDGRIASRLSTATVIEMTGVDRRKAK